MPLHGLARINILLLKLPDKENYVEISKKSLEALLFNHNVYSDNKLFYVSYHYNTKDCTLNVNTELLEWIIRLNEMKPNPDYEKMAVGIINLILTEQNMDGSWNYFSKDYAKSQGIKKDCPDLHHTATILRNLTESLIIAKFLGPNLKKDILDAIIKGFSYAFHTFFKIKGEVLTATIYPWGRTAGPVQLSEMLLAINSFLSYYKTSEAKISVSIIQGCKDLANALTIKLCKFVTPDGSVPSEKIIHWINIDSIRWGNGIVLQALAEQYIKNLNE